jgi:subtilisin family serine protease
VPGYSDSAQDNNGHGTHVGGIIAARDNDRDVVGVAPRAVLYAVKVLDENGWGYDSDIIAGLEWVLVNGAQLNPPIRVANLSLGRLRCEDDSALHAAVARVVDSGVVVVAAAGNDAAKDVRDMVPAGFPEVIAVASATASSGTSSRLYGSIRADTASSFTTDGAMDEYGVGVAISAPGEEREDIDHRGWINSIGILSTKLGGGTTRMSGTSMAAPHVAGVVALLFEQNPNLLPIAAKIKIMNGTLAMAAPYDSRSTQGYPVPSYSFDGDREGILSARNALYESDGVSAEP